MKTNSLVKVVVLGCAALPVLAATHRDVAKPQLAVFVMTNSAEQNEIASFGRLPNGTLQLIGMTSTGGRGSGGTVDPLGSQGSLTLSQDHSLLFAVNAGSGTVSSFEVGDTLELRDVEPTGGAAPVAVAQSDDLVYVLNFAGNSNVVGFRLDAGKLISIPNSVRYLSAANSGASSLTFSPDGKFLAVTEKLTNKIDVYPVQANGTLGTPVIYTDPSAGLFDAEFSPDGALISLEAAAAGVSSFWVSGAGALSPVSTDVPTKGAGSCWIAITSDGSWVYTSNSASATISGYSLAGGTLTPLPGTVVATLPAGSTNLDLAIDGSNQYLYSVNGGTGTVSAYWIQNNGTLKLIGLVGGLPAAGGLNGIAAL